MPLHRQLASDPAKRNVSAAPMYPLYIEEMHRMLTGLVGQVEALTVQMASFKQFEYQVSLVIADLEKLSSVFSKLESMPKICDSLQTISGFLSKCVGSDAAVSSEAPANSSGGKEYVS